VSVTIFYSALFQADNSHAEETPVTTETGIAAEEEAPAEGGGISPMLLPSGYGLSAATVTNDTAVGNQTPATIDLMTATAATRGYYSKYEATAGYQISVTAVFPMGGASVTDKKLEIILPPSLTWSQDGAQGDGVSSILTNLVPSGDGNRNSILKTQQWNNAPNKPGYGGVKDRGRTYLVSTAADGYDVGTVSFTGLTFTREGSVKNQSFTGDSEEKIIIRASWIRSGVYEYEEVELSNLTLWGNLSTEYASGSNEFGGFVAVSSWPYNTNNSTGGMNVLGGSSGNIYDATITMSASGGQWIDSVSYKLRLSYSGSNAALAAMTPLQLAQTFPITASGTLPGNYTITGPDAAGDYTISCTNFTGVFSSSAAGNKIPLQINLEDSRLSPGDVVTVTHDRIYAVGYKGLVFDSTAPGSWTVAQSTTRTQVYTIVTNVEDVRVYQSGDSPTDQHRTLMQKGQDGVQAYDYYIDNVGGANSTVKDISFDFSGAAGKVKISPSYMVLPLENGQHINRIYYTLTNGASGYIDNGGLGWTGNSTRKLTLTAADWTALNPAWTDEQRNTLSFAEIHYTLGSVPGMTAATTDPYTFFGQWTDLGAATVSSDTGTTPAGSGTVLNVTITDTGTTSPSTATNVNPINNAVSERQAWLADGAPNNVTYNAGSTYTATIGYVRCNHATLLEQPIFYIRNTSTNEIDLSSFVVQHRVSGEGVPTQVEDITAYADISGPYTLPDGSQLYRVDLSDLAAKGGQQKSAWMFESMYAFDEDGSELVTSNGSYMIGAIHVAYDVTVPVWAANGDYPYAYMYFIGNWAAYPLGGGAAGWWDGGSKPSGYQYFEDLVINYENVNQSLDLNANNVAGPSSYAMTIKALKDLQVYIETKLTSEPDTAYVAHDASYVLQAGGIETVTMRVNMVNPSTTTLSTAAIVVPIPKEGANWGVLSPNNGVATGAPFPFTMELTGPVSPVSTTHTTPGIAGCFTVLYNLSMSPADDWSTIDSATGWLTEAQMSAMTTSTYNPYTDVVAIKIVASGVPYDNSGATPAIRFEANRFSFTMEMRIPYDSNEPATEQVDSFKPIYYREIYIPPAGGYAEERYTGAMTGITTNIRSRSGELGGRVWVDADADGQWDAAEQAAGAGWKVYLLKPDAWNETTYLANPAAFIAAAAASGDLVGSQTTDAQGRYLFTLLNRFESGGYFLLAENPDTGSYRFTVINDPYGVETNASQKFYGADYRPALHMELTALSVTDMSTLRGEAARLLQPAAYLQHAGPGIGVAYQLGLAPVTETWMTWDGYGIHDIGVLAVGAGAKQADPPDGTHVIAGDTITYTIDAIPDVNGTLTVTDNLSYFVTLYAITINDLEGADYASYNATDHAITWRWDNAVAGQNYPIEFTVQVLPGEPLGKVVYNRALVNGVTTNAIEHPIDVPKYADPWDGTHVIKDDVIAYTVEATAASDGALIIIDELDPDVKLTAAQKAAISDGGVYNPITHEITWIFYGVTAGTTKQVTFSVTVLTRTGEVLNYATISNGTRSRTNTTTHPIDPPPTAEIRLHKVIGNVGDYSGTESWYLQQEVFIIRMSSGGVTMGDALLSHGQYTHFLEVDADAVFSITEIVPMEYASNYVVSIEEYEGSLGTPPSLSGNCVTVHPGNIVTVTVTNTFEHDGYFKDRGWITNLFEKATGGTA
jgi:hypothetical protein